MASVALCIPTYQRHECVGEFLKEYAGYYQKYDIDIYYYDSSPDDKTFSVVKKFSDKMQDLYYVRMPVEMHSNKKVYKIFQQYGLKKKYDFIWVCNDAIRYSEKALFKIMEKVDDSYDIIEPDYDDVEQLGIKEYENYNLYLEECAWKLTLYGAALLNVNTLLSDVNWEIYEKKFLKSEVINFSHVSLYFNRIAEMNNFRALHIPIENKEFKSSMYKKKPGWHNDTLFILCESWVKTIERLPDCYMTKKEAMRKPGMFTVFQSEKLFQRLKIEGILDVSKFFKYRKKWKKVCNIPPEKIFLISIVPAKIWENKEKRQRKIQLKKCTEFMKRYSGVVIYGAGNWAYLVGSYCKMKKIEFEYFCVTSLNQNKKSYMDHPVKELIDVVDDLRSKAIILCMRDDYALEVIDMLRKLELSDNMYYDQDLFETVSYELGYTT